MLRALFRSSVPLVDDHEILQHQLQLLHAELLREDKRKREAIRHELACLDAKQAFIAAVRKELAAA